MQALPASVLPATGGTGVLATAGFMRRWSRSMVEMVPAAMVFALGYIAYTLPFAVAGQDRGFNLFMVCAFGPAVTMAILVPLVAATGTVTPFWRGRLPALAAAAVTATAIGSVIDANVLTAMRVWGAPRWSMGVLLWSNFGFNAIYFVCATLVIDHHVRAKRRSASLRALRLDRAGVIRRTAEARLQAVQARVDPQFLFETLAAVERVYDEDVGEGDRVLEDVIAYLRALLPDLHGTTSTISREIELATAWVAIRRVLRHEQLTISIEAADEITRARFPSLIVVPLMEELLAGASQPAALAFCARRAGQLLSLQVRCTGSMRRDPVGESQSLAALRVRLQDLYGDAAHLSLSFSEAGGCECTLEIPYEACEGGDR